MSDAERLSHLLRAGYPCLHIPTVEEDEALGVLRDIAMAAGRRMWVWSHQSGLRDALLQDSPPIGKTDEPAAALRYVSELRSADLVIMLYLLAHRQRERPLRALRDALALAPRYGSAD